MLDNIIRRQIFDRVSREESGYVSKIREICLERGIPIFLRKFNRGNDSRP